MELPPFIFIASTLRDTLPQTDVQEKFLPDGALTLFSQFKEGYDDQDTEALARCLSPSFEGDFYNAETKDGLIGVFESLFDDLPALARPNLTIELHEIMQNTPTAYEVILSFHSNVTVGGFPNPLTKYDGRRFLCRVELQGKQGAWKKSKSMKTVPLRILAFLCFSLLLRLHTGHAQAPKYEPTFADVRYGEYDRDLLDFFQAKTTAPAPVLIYFHGGGWMGGDKKSFNSEPILKFGVSVVAANYRFTTGTPDAAPYPAPMVDSARVVQFVRSKAEEWHIDPNRIALTGGSAGAVISMWIAYRDEMAKPNSTDPIERFSTRVTCIMPQSGPTVLDPKVILKRVGGNPSIHPAMLPFFGAKNIEQLDEPDKQELIADASPITHVTSDDPPTFTQYGFPLGGTPLPPETPIGTSIHHSEFGVILKDKLDAVGVENVLQTKDDGSDPMAMWKFLINHLKPEFAPADAK